MISNKQLKCPSFSKKEHNTLTVGSCSHSHDSSWLFCDIRIQPDGGVMGQKLSILRERERERESCCVHTSDNSNCNDVFTILPVYR